MTRCPITYVEIPEGSRYSPGGMKLLSRRLKDLKDFPFSAEEQRQEAAARATTMSIQGVQPKLSARLEIPGETFEIVATGGNYILKPQTQFQQVPENEDLTMRLASSIGIEVPPHGLMYSKDGTLTYFIKRFDRTGKVGRLAVEDFSQLRGKMSETKYDSSMEQVVSIIDRYATFPALDKLELFRRTLFNFLVGNKDTHLKDFSLIHRDGKIELSPAYDLVNTTIVLPNATDEIALPLGGKKKNLSRGLLVEYFAGEKLRLTKASIDGVLRDCESAWENWQEIIMSSFLAPQVKAKYTYLVLQRRLVLEF